MSHLEKLHYCLRVEFARNRKSKTITLSLNKYIKEELKGFLIQDCKPIRISLEENEEYIENEHQMQSILYKAIIGSLVYAMVGTKMDLAFL